MKANDNMNKTCIIGVYFGNFPTYFNLWLKTCEYNKDFDFLIFTNNNPYEYSVPDNVRFINIDLSYISARLTQILGVDVRLSTPYKCCDCKPLYGKIFKEYLKEYQFWGHCDFDLMWGDLFGFCDKYHQASYDKFLSLGHLSLYKNTTENNERYLLDGSKVGNYKSVYTTNVNVGFDEEDGIVAIYEKNKLPMFSERIYADISPTYKRFRCARKDKNYPYQVFFWREGKTFRAYYIDGDIKEEEFIYIHFQKRGELNVHGEINFDTGFFITNTGFYPMERKYVTLDDIKKYNPFKSEIFEKIEKIWKRTFGRNILNALMYSIKLTNIKKEGDDSR